MPCNSFSDIICFGSFDEPWALISPHSILPFNIHGVRFYSLQHYIVFQKAMLFGDSMIRSDILSASIPGDLVWLNNQITIPDPDLWIKFLYPSLISGIMIQVIHYSNLRKILLQTGDSYLVFLSEDTILGSAFDESSGSYCGENMVGKALIEVRSYFQMINHFA